MVAMESLLHFQAFAEMSKDLLWICTEQGVLTYVNPTWTNILQYTEQELLGNKITNYTRSSQNNSLKFICKDGHSIVASVQIQSLFDSEGNRQGECGSAQIRENPSWINATYRAYIENSYDVIFTLNSQGEFLFASPAWERHFGYPTSEIIGKSFAHFVHPEDVPPCTEYLESCMRSGVSSTSPPYRVKCADGRLIWFIANGTPYTNDQGGGEFIGVGRDIHEQKQAEQALRESEEKFAKVFRHAPVLIAITDMDTARYLEINDQALKDTGFSREEVIGHTAAEIGWINIEDRALLVNEIKTYGHIAGLEMEFHAKNGSIMNGWVKGGPLTLGNRNCLLTVTSDITERKIAEETLRENRAELERNERRLALAMTATTDALWEWNYQTGETYYSPRWYEMLGYKNQEFQMNFEAFERLCHPDDFPKTVALINVVLQDENSKGYSAEFRMRHRNGSWLWIMGRGNVLAAMQRRIRFFCVVPIQTFMSES